MDTYVCPRCEGTGMDPENSDSEYYGDNVTRDVPEPCYVCQLPPLALYSFATGYPHLSAEPDAVPACMACGCRIGWIECPTGGWWAHLTHPVDEHDAKPITLENVANCTTGNPISCVDSCCPWPTPGF